MTIRSTLIRAKLTQLPVTVTMDDDAVLSGKIEELDEVTLKLRQAEAVTFVPVADIKDVNTDSIDAEDSDEYRRGYADAFDQLQRALKVKGNSASDILDAYNEVVYLSHYMNMYLAKDLDE
jgi:hypothetical protein